MKGVLSMKTNMQEINEPAFHAYLKKAQSSPNTIRSCLAAYRLYHSLYNDLAVNHLLCFKDYLIRHYKASTVNNRIYGINRYLDFLEEIYGSQMIHFRLTVIRTQQAAFLDNIISQEDYETFKKRLKDSGNMLWYFVVRFLACTGARVSELIQIKAEHLHLGYIDLYTKGGKVRRLHFPDALCQEALEWLSAKGQVSGFCLSTAEETKLLPAESAASSRHWPYAVTFRLKQYTLTPSATDLLKIFLKSLMISPCLLI